MKKALVLGVLAFFAINIASVQDANAQERTTSKTQQTKKELKMEKKATSSSTAAQSQQVKKEKEDPAKFVQNPEKTKAPAKPNAVKNDKCTKDQKGTCCDQKSNKPDDKTVEKPSTGKKVPLSKPSPNEKKEKKAKVAKQAGAR